MGLPSALGCITWRFGPIGMARWSAPARLKTVQEVIALIVFAVLAVLHPKTAFTLNHLGPGAVSAIGATGGQELGNIIAKTCCGAWRQAKYAA